MNDLKKPTFVYFIQAGGEDGPIKIGHSRTPPDRLADLQTSNHLDLRLLAQFQFEGRGAESFETKLHTFVFGDLRIRGEWFRCDPRILRLIRSMQLVESEHRGTDKDFTLRIKSIDAAGEDLR